MIQLNRVRPANTWYNLKNLNLSDPYFTNKFGVYIIRHGGNNAKVVRVGQGNISERLAEHRSNEEILAYQHHGLYVTRAIASPTITNGIETYLGETLNPIVGEKFPHAIKTAVNLPR